MKRLCTRILFAWAVLGPQVAAAGAPDPLFADDAALRVTITAPLSTLLGARPDTPSLAGLFSYTGADGAPVELDVQIQARGNFRLRNCDLPPLHLNFKKSQVADTLLDHQNKLKMVVRCKDTVRYEQSVLREYLAYRLLNALTDLSFRVRLLQVTYVDSNERISRMVRSGFFIEHENRLAARIGQEKRDIEGTDISAIAPDHLNLTSMFQFLIGNTDFSPNLGSNNECCHNYAMFGSDGDTLLAIPYDFDMSGFVNAPYAAPDPELGIENVRQRLYQGYCANNGYVQGSISRFNQAREALYALLAQQQELEPTVRQTLVSYMDEFYGIISDPAKVEQQILGKCL